MTMFDTLNLSPMAQEQIRMMAKIADLAGVADKTYLEVKTLVSEIMQAGATFDDALAQADKQLRPRLTFKDNYLEPPLFRKVFYSYRANEKIRFTPPT